MGERFTLDVDSFQRLLAAAWVLQCQSDRKTSDEIRAVDSAVLLQRKVNWIPANFPIPSHIFEVDMKLSQSEVPNAGTGSRPEPSAGQAAPIPFETQNSLIGAAPVLRPKPAASVSLQPEVSGTLALAPEQHDVAETSAIPFLLDELEEESVWERVERTISGAVRRSLGIAAEWRERWRSKLHVKVIIRGRTRDHLARYAAPVFALLVVGVMLTPQISRRVGWLRSVRAAAHLSGNVIGAGGAGPALETSHLRVTDAVEVAALNQMSRYEVRSMRRQAQFGDDAAALTLGMAYETGHGVSQNCEEAARWVELAALDGNAAAQYNLGLRYRSGDGVREDHAEARKWLEAASRQGYARASLILQSSGF